jgi:hypothetical protein
MLSIYFKRRKDGLNGIMGLSKGLSLINISEILEGLRLNGEMP